LLVQSLFTKSQQFFIFYRAEVKAINAAIGCTNILSECIWTKCPDFSKMPVINFVLGGKNYPLKGSDYVLQIKSGSKTQCVSGFMGMDLPGKLAGGYILGDVFISTYYTFFLLLACFNIFFVQNI